jgi:hypothetical protein
MDIKDIFLVISIVVGLVTPLIGIRSIFKGEYKPQRTTRVIFLLLLFISVASLLAQKDRVAIVLAVLQWLTSLIIFVLSFKYGVGGFEKKDIVVFFMAMITLIIWKTTSNPALALYMSILTDFIGLSPTLIKAYKQPYTEDPKFYASDTMSGFFNLIAVKNYQLNALAFPGYIFLINLFCFLLVMGRRRIYERSL